MAEKQPAKKKSSSSAKQQMLESLTEVAPLIEQRLTASARPEQKLEERAASESVALADALSSEGVVKSISELRSSVGKMLAQLSDKLEEEASKYVQIKRAIAAKEQELRDIYEIQKSASTLTALIEAHQRKQEEFEKDLEAQREELAREIETTRQEWAEERKQHEIDIKERDAVESKKRERDREEYRYTFAREQQLAKDQFEDESAKANREFEEKKSETEKSLAQREKAIVEREKEFAEIRAKADSFNKTLQSAIAEAVAEANQRSKADASAREELLKREYAGEKNVLGTRITLLEQTVKEQNVQIARLSEQAEKAYTQVQDIAVKAIEGSSNFKSLTSLQQLLSDQNRKQGQDK
jgi:hypothetical protein